MMILTRRVEPDAPTTRVSPASLVCSHNGEYRVMKLPDWMKPRKRGEKIIFTFAGLFILALLVQTAASLGILLPTSIDDFVVDSHENIVVVSDFHHRIYYISKNGRLLNSISMPEGGGGIRMAVDTSDNIYINRRRGVGVYSLNGVPKHYSVTLDKTDDWLLQDGFKITNLNKTMSYDYSNCTSGSRKPVNFGEFLFHDIKCDNSLGRSFEFRTSTKEYDLSPFWNNNVSVSDHQGRLLYKITITPIYLKVFAFPIPFLGILLILAAVYWITVKFGDPYIK